MLWSVSLSNQPISRSWKYVHIWRHFVTWIKVRRWFWTDPMQQYSFCCELGHFFFLDNQWVSWVHSSDHKWPVLINSRYNNLSLSYGSSFSVNGEPWITARQPKCPRHSYFHFNCSLSLFLEICHIWSIQAILSREDASFIDFSEPAWTNAYYQAWYFHFFIPLQTDRLCQIHDKLRMLPFWKYIALEQKLQEPRRSTPEKSA